MNFNKISQLVRKQFKYVLIIHSFFVYWISKSGEMNVNFRWLNNSKNIRLFSVVYLFLFCNGLNTISADAADHQTVVKVGVYDNQPKIFIDSQGNPSGIFIDIIESIANKEHLEIQYIENEWASLMDMLYRGEIDILPDMSYSKERDSLFTLSSLPVIESWLEVFTIRNIDISSIMDLQGKKIGVLNGSIQQKYLDNVLNKNFNLSYDIQIFKSYSNSVKALKNEQIDLILADRFFYFSELFDNEILSTGIILRPAGLHFAFPKDKNPKLVQIFDQNLSSLKNDPDSDYYSSIQKWLSNSKTAKIPNYAIWLIIIFGLSLVIVSAFALLLRYKVGVKTKILSLRNEQLVAANASIEESDRLKTVFLQNMSHEIRTPMNGILGFLGLLNEPDLDIASRKKYFEIVKESGQRLLNTINDIIELSKLESNQIQTSYAEVDINELLDFHLEYFTPPAKQKGLQLFYSKRLDNQHSHVVSDKQILNSILNKLITNAIKFTEEGKVEFGVYIKDSAMIFFVKDTGVGIPTERFEAIYERFVHADLSISRPHEGAGLGLSIVKSYIEMLNGKIWVESEISKGSSFFFFIPYRPCIQEVKKVAENEVQSNFSKKYTKILVAEDDENSFYYIQTLLKNETINILRSNNGQDAIKTVKEIPDISLILMDIKMPIMNGLEATRQIREFNKNVPIIAQTAYAMIDDKKNVIEAGCNDYITKPIDKKELLRMIHQYVQFD